MTVAHKNKGKVYQLILQSHNGISINQISQKLNGKLTVPYSVADLIIAMRIRLLMSDLTSSILYVAVEPNAKDLSHCSD